MQDGDRSVNLNLENPLGDAGLGALAQAVLNILDEDGGGGGCRLDAKAKAHPNLFGLMLTVWVLLLWRGGRKHL